MALNVWAVKIKTTSRLSHTKKRPKEWNCCHFRSSLRCKLKLISTGSARNTQTMPTILRWFPRKVSMMVLSWLFQWITMRPIILISHQTSPSTSQANFQLMPMLLYRHSTTEESLLRIYNQETQPSLGRPFRLALTRPLMPKLMVQLVSWNRLKLAEPKTCWSSWWARVKIQPRSKL